MYGDRTYLMTSVPDYLVGSDWIRTACDSKIWAGETLVSFNIAAEADVYVAHNNEIPTRPAWLSEFTEVGDSIETAFNENFNLFKKTYDKGTVSLGANSDYTNHRGNYIVIVVPTETAGLSSKETEEMLIYPNPSHDFIMVKSDKINAITFYNDMGQKVMTKSIVNNQQIDISKLASGVYFTELTSTNNDVTIQRLIKQ